MCLCAAAEQPATPSPFDYTLYQAMCEFASFKDSEAECYPSQKLLARILGVTRPTVNRHIQRIESFGWITISKIRELGAKWEHNIYQLLKPFTISDLAARRITRRAHRRKSFSVVSVRGGQPEWRFTPCGCDNCRRDKTKVRKPRPLKPLSITDRLRWMRNQAAGGYRAEKFGRNRS